MTNQIKSCPLIKVIIFISLIITLNIKLSAQPTYQKIYTSNSFHFFLDMHSTFDGGAVFQSRRGLVKVNCKGNIEWTKEDIYSFNTFEHPQKMFVTDEGDIFMATGIKVFPQAPAQTPHIHLMKYDNSGNLIWQKQYGKVPGEQLPRTITSTPDGGYLLGATKSEMPSDTTRDFYFLRIDSTGNLLWTKTFGEPDLENNIVSSIADETGNTYHIGSNKRTDGMTVSDEGFIIKLSPVGDVLFYKKMEYPEFSTFPRDLVLTNNGDIFITGYARKNTDLSFFTSFLHKINSNGDVIYQKTFNTNSDGKVEYSLSILPLENGGYAIGGFIKNIAQFSTLYPTFPRVFITLLDEDENYISSKSYNHDTYPQYASLQLKSKESGDYNLAFATFVSDDPYQWGTTLIQLDENFSSGCNEADISDEIFLEDEAGWSLVDLPANPVPYGFQFTHLYELESFEYDTIISICDNFAKADFSVQNLCPESDEPIIFQNNSSGEIISWEWNIDDVVFTNNENIVEYNFAGSQSFVAQLIVDDGCTIDTISKVIKKYPPSEIAQIDTVICSDRPFIFNGSTYVESVSEDQTFIYEDTLTNIFGCDSIDRLVALIEVCGCEMIFPNAFTPDQDGLNDFFHPIIDCDYQIENYRLMLFNRWGQLIFNTNNLEEKWDGTFQGKPVPMDVLVFKIQYDVMDWNGVLIRQANESGDVTLIR